MMCASFAHLRKKDMCYSESIAVIYNRIMRTQAEVKHYYTPQYDIGDLASWSKSLGAYYTPHVFSRNMTLVT